jgi:hypothetical protein
MAVDDRLCDVHHLVAVVLGVVAQHLERSIPVDCVPCHQDPLGLLDQSAASERSLQAVVLGEALKRDVDRALKLLRAPVDDVGEDSTLGGFMHVRRVFCRQECDHRAGSLADDLRDQLERVLGVQPKTDEGDVRPLPGRDRADFLDVDLAGDHLVPETGHDLREEFESLAPLVGDQNAEVPGLVVGRDP